MKNKNIVVLDKDTLGKDVVDWEKYENLGNVSFYDSSTREESLERVKDANIILTNKTIIDKKILDIGKNIEYIGVLATGYNILDMKECEERDITITNIPDYGTDTVAQFTIALLLKMCNEVSHHNDLVKKGEWIKREIFSFWDTDQIELAGKTIGIIGYGKIGRKVGEICKAFGMKVLAYRGENKEKRYEEEVSLNYLLENSDIISLHANLNKSNENIINKKTIDKMKDGVMIINVARGGLIDEDALYNGIKSKKIRSVALDVLQVEPVSKDNPLLKCDNVTITPHMAWSTVNARQRILDTAYDNVEAYLQGKPINKVN